ncbi:hypothetical protein U0070_000994 [Myodes glareolus]|uniref:Uncharacterized protein n=1 Tax=Myodes glareolus TaxID=447135 RepID=A0AAW0IEY9_MYOGA
MELGLVEEPELKVMENIQKLHQEFGIKLNTSMQDDVLECLTDAEKLVVELKTSVARRTLSSCRRTKLCRDPARAAACDALREENSELLREKSEQAAGSAQAIQQLEESSPEGLVSKAGLQQEQELLNKDRGQKRRKTQAALVHWKELLQRVSTLEEELAKHDQNETSEEMKVEELKCELQKEKLISCLQVQLHQAWSEQAKKHYNTKQEVSELKKLPEEERDHRLVIENARSLAEEQIPGLEQSEWDSARTPIIGACGSQETSVLIDIPGSSCRRVREKDAGRARLWEWAADPEWRWMEAGSAFTLPFPDPSANACNHLFLMVHVLLILCFSGPL